MAARKKAAAKKRTPRRRSADTKKKGKLQTPFVATPEQRRAVEKLAGYGMTYREICAVMHNPDTGRGISVNTLQKHFQTELQTGRAKIKAGILDSIYHKAMSREHPQSAVCAMFVLKCQFGWRQNDTVRHELAPQSGVLVVPAARSPDEWIEEQRKKNEARRPPRDSDDE